MYIRADPGIGESLCVGERQKYGGKHGGESASISVEPQDRSLYAGEIKVLFFFSPFLFFSFSLIFFIQRFFMFRLIDCFLRPRIDSNLG